MEFILNKRMFIFLFALVIFGMGLFADEADAAIQTDLSVSPNPAKINSPVKIKITANDSGNSILLIDLSIDGQFTSGHDCTGGTNNPVNNCEAVFTKQFPAEKSYRISGTITDIDGALENTSEIILNVTASGGLPDPSPGGPIIDSINPDPAPIGSAVNIAGTNFCSNIDFDISNITVIFDQTAVSGGASVSVLPSPEPKSSCDVLSAIVPGSLIAENNVKVFVQNTKGVSAPENLNLESPLPGGDTPAQTIKGKLELSWPPSPLGTRLEEDIVILIKYFYEWGISLGGLLVFIVLVMAGFQYLTSAGNPGKMGEAMERIRSAIIGLALLLASVLILNTINPQLTQLKVPPLPLTPKPLKFNAMNPSKITDPGDCKSVTFYEGINRTGGSFSVKSFNEERTINSIEIDGGCMVFLYQLSGQRQNADYPLIPVSGDIASMEAYASGITTFRSGKVVAYPNPK